MSETGAATPVDQSPFARRRAGARLAAVQALYQMDVAGRGSEAVVREFLEFRLPKDERVEEVDPEHFSAIVRGVVEEQRTVDAAVAGVLAKGWKPERLDKTVRAILRCGAWELSARPDTPRAVVIDEYVNVAAGFFDGSELNFINAALDKLAKATDAEA